MTSSKCKIKAINNKRNHFVIDIFSPVSNWFRASSGKFAHFDNLLSENHDINFIRNNSQYHCNKQIPWNISVTLRLKYTKYTGKYEKKKFYCLCDSKYLFLYLFLNLNAMCRRKRRWNIKRKMKPCFSVCNDRDTFLNQTRSNLVPTKLGAYRNDTCDRIHCNCVVSKSEYSGPVLETLLSPSTVIFVTKQNRIDIN